jgi:hypothetical protein
MKRTFSLTLLAVLGACSDRVTAPEAEAVLSAVERPLASGEVRRRLWEHMGSADVLGRLRTTSRVQVWQDGRELSLAGIVFERVMVPPSGSGRSSCLGPRWFLYLWHQSERPEGLVLSGGRFDQALSQGGMCSDINFSVPTPFVAWYPAEEPADRGWPAGWVSVGGHGGITPGTDVGPCSFLASTDAGELYQTMGITCRVTRHRVYLQSTLQRFAPNGRLDGTLGTMQVRVPQVEVLGVRYTIECRLPQAAFMCRHVEY